MWYKSGYENVREYTARYNRSEFRNKHVIDVWNYYRRGEKESRKREKLSKGRMLLPARRQILGRDLRIQILALVRARETDCRIRRKPGVPKGERVFSVFFLPIPLAFATSWPPLDRRSARFPTVSQTRVLFAERTDLHVCASRSRKVLFTGISPGEKVGYDEKARHRWWLNSHPC